MEAHVFNYSIREEAQECFQVLVQLEHHSMNVSTNNYMAWPRRIKIRVLLGGVSQACNPSIWETNEETQILVQPGQDSENLFKKTKSQIILEPQTRVS